MYAIDYKTFNFRDLNWESINPKLIDSETNEKTIIKIVDSLNSSRIGN